MGGRSGECVIFAGNLFVVAASSLGDFVGVWKRFRVGGGCKLVSWVFAVFFLSGLRV